MSLSKWLPCDFEQCHPLLWSGGILVDHWSTISSCFESGISFASGNIKAASVPSVIYGLIIRLWSFCPGEISTTMYQFIVAGTWSTLLQLVAFNSLWPSDTMWWHRSGSTLVQVMACYLTAPSHYLNQCWLIIKGLWHLFEGITIRGSEDTDQYRKKWKLHFYPRPVLAFGYCRCLRLSVCPSVRKLDCVATSFIYDDAVNFTVDVRPWVRQSLACPRDNSSPVQARITKFGP